MSGSILVSSLEMPVAPAPGPVLSAHKCLQTLRTVLQGTESPWVDNHWAASPLAALLICINLENWGGPHFQ